MQQRFENQVAVITGAGRGIGHAIALRLASEGARVASVSRTETNAQKTAQEINASRADAAKAYTVDVSDHGAVRKVCDLPIVAQMTTEEDGNTLDGTPPERFTPELERRGATVIGVNCAVGPAPMLDTIERMAAVTERKLSAQPNAGKPRDVEGRNIYLCSPEYMASYARRFILHNVRIVGGCCGTTPEHIRQIKTAVRGLAAAVGRAGESAGSHRAEGSGGVAGASEVLRLAARLRGQGN